MFKTAVSESSSRARQPAPPGRVPSRRRVRKRPGGRPRDARSATRTAGPSNALRDSSRPTRKGRGIFKWLHYFEIYDRHLAKFVGKDVHIVEIGVFSGGSLGMWHSYFGPRARITGVDIMPACKVYENEFTKIEIGDQSDRSFWKRFRDEYPPVDIVIDDGGHMSEQQMVTLEELLPHVSPGGVYICEDVHTPESLHLVRERARRRPQRVRAPTLTRPKTS